MTLIFSPLFVACANVAEFVGSKNYSIPIPYGFKFFGVGFWIFLSRKAADRTFNLVTSLGDNQFPIRGDNDHTEIVKRTLRSMTHAMKCPSDDCRLVLEGDFWIAPRALNFAASESATGPLSRWQL